MVKSPKAIKIFFEKHLTDTFSIAGECSCLGYIYRRKQAAIVEMLKPRKTDEVLEVGCGTGLGAIFLAKYVKNVYATDLSKGRIRIAKEHATSVGLQWKINFLVCDALRLPFRDSCFDSAFCIGMLHHVPRYRECLMEIVKTTRKFLCVEPNYFNPARARTCRIGRRTYKLSFFERDIPFFLLKRSFGDCGLVGLKIRWIIFLYPKLNGLWLYLFTKLALMLEKLPLVKFLAGNVVVYGRLQQGCVS